MQKKEVNQIVINTEAIINGILVLVGIWLAWKVKTILFALFISLVIAFGLDPLVEFLQKRKVPKFLAVLVTYVSVLAIVITIGTVAFTPMVNQTIALVNNFPSLLEEVSNNNFPFLENLDQEITEQLANIGQQAIQTTLNAFSTAILTITVMVFTAYLLLDFNNVKKHAIKMFPKDKQKKVEKTINTSEHKLGSWIRGQLALMLIIGALTYVGLTLLGVKFALSLALIAGILELIPIIGPIISTIPALIVALGNSPVQAIGVLGLYILIQQLENNIVVPKVMQKAVGFNPLVTMSSILIGGELFGIIGALVAVPATLFGVVVYKNFFGEDANK